MNIMRLNSIALLLVVLAIATANSLPVGGRSKSAVVSDRRRNDARALPVVISQYSNVRNSKTDTPVSKESLKAGDLELETSTTATTTTSATTTTTSAATTTTSATTTTTAETELIAVSEAAIQNEQTVEVAELLALPADDQAKIGEDSTLSPAEEQQTELPINDPDTKPAPIQTEAEQVDSAPIFDQVVPSQSTNADIEIKDEIAKEDEKVGELPAHDSNGQVAPLVSPTAQQEEQNVKLEQLFEEDRSFKNNFDDLTALIDDKATNESPVTPSSLFKELFQWDNDDMSADEKKSDAFSKKDKEKQMIKAKESKPSKLTKLNEDPVDEYEENLRRKRSTDQDPENDKADSPTVISFVPSSYPVVLPNGESTLSDRENLKEEKSADEKEGGPVVVSLVPSNYPVVLPDGVSTLSDKLKPEEEATIEKSGNENEEKPVVISLVPSNYPVVLPDGTSTLSDQIKREDQQPENPAPVIIEEVSPNFPVVLPDGTPTLSDRASGAQENRDSTATVVTGKIPSNFPIVLPDGTQTLSDKVPVITRRSEDTGAPAVIAPVPDSFSVVWPKGEQTMSDKL